MTKRPYIPFKTRLAATLCHMLRPDEKGNLVPIIDHESAKNMTEDQILSVFNFDHYPVAKSLGGPDEHWNLTPRPIIEHRTKSAKIDTPMAAKVVRVTRKQAEFRQKMLAKIGQADPIPKKGRRLTKPKGCKFDWSIGRYVKE